MYDDGGSSKIIRDAFDIPPPGDLRNCLMNLADESKQGKPEIIDVFSHRLAYGEYKPGSLQQELDSFINATHQKMQSVEPGLANIIGLYLNEFDQRKPIDFDLRRASVGNLVMVGCYFLHGNDFENAEYLIASLARVKGAVIPVTLGNYYLGAVLSDRTIVIGQANITNQKGRYTAPIERIFFLEKKSNEAPEIDVSANPRAISALSDVDVIVYSMGSFYTSIIPCLMTKGIASAIRSSNAHKVFIANSIADDESKNLTVSKMLRILVSICQEYDPHPGEVQDYVQYVIANDHGMIKEQRGRAFYIPVDKDDIVDTGVGLLEYPLEENRGKFDPDLMSRILLSFAHM